MCELEASNNTERSNKIETLLRTIGCTKIFYLDQWACTQLVELRDINVVNLFTISDKPMILKIIIIKI